MTELLSPPSPPSSPRGGLLSQAVGLVASLLRDEVARMRAAGVPVGQDDYRGLYIADQEAERLLALIGSDGSSIVLRDEADVVGVLMANAAGRLRTLLDAARLTPFEVAVLLLCFACETDLGIERLISYVQDDVSKRRPRVDLAIRMFAGPGSHGAALDSLHPQAPLRALRLIEVHDDPSQAVTPMLARSLSLDPAIQAYLLGGERLNPALARTAVWLPAGTGAALPRPATVEALASGGVSTLARPVVVWTGPDPAVRRAAVGRVAEALGLRLLAVDFAALVELHGVSAALVLAEREAVLHGAALLLEGFEELSELDLAIAIETLETHSLPAFVAISTAATVAWPGAVVHVPGLAHEDRERLWQTHLEGIAGDVVTALAGRFRLGAVQIGKAATAAHGRAAQRLDRRIVAEDLFASARDQSTPILSSLARKVVPHYGWDDIVLPYDSLAQLREMCAQVEHRHLVYDIWGFDRKLALGKGVISLFAGNPGTGKTMAAEIMAKAIELDLYKIDLSGIVSKYIGETEKNLSAVFAEAESANAILFFDEADALFGKRSEVKDAHDRYANIETAYLLQRLEEYPGLVILATNLKMNLDDAFLRRLHFVVDFPMPEEAERLRILEGCIPAALPVGGDLDLGFVAKQFKVSGGNIRNIVLAAAFLAASDGSSLSMKHLMWATRREYQKMGRMVTEAEFGEHVALFRRDAAR